jgi:transcriptional regulator with XRE-family HTH domain
MHLVGGQDVQHLTGVYHGDVIKARPDTLPFIFQKLRIHRNLTKESLGKKCGVSEKYVSSVESCSRYPSLNFCLQCATEFEINPSWVKEKWVNGRVSKFRDSLFKRLKVEN